MADCDKMISQQTYCLVLYTVSCQVIFPHSPGLFSEFYGISNLISTLKHDGQYLKHTHNHITLIVAFMDTVVRMFKVLAITRSWYMCFSA